MTKKPNSYGVLSSLLLFLTFLPCSMSATLIGSRVCENVRTNNNASFYSDTAVSYTTNKVRQTDRIGSVEVQETDGYSVLVLSSSANGLQCETWVYILNGVLKELYTEKDGGLTVENGLDIMGCTSLDSTSQETANQLIIHLEAEPFDITARLLLRSEPKGGVES